VEPGLVLADRYQILAPIGEGSSSTVWEARDRVSGGIVAVKAVSMERAGWRSEVRDRFQQEARLLTMVRHRHLVGVRAFGETEDGYLYLVLDRLSGETLTDRLARPPRLRWREAAAIALELARGLAALHARRIVHRDLKPANVILAETGGEVVAKIIDLGIGKVGTAATDPGIFATLTATGQVLGTPEYMSYEQALGERDVDARTDVWALGVVLHEMLTGRRPFTGDNVNAVLAAIRNAPRPRLVTAVRGTPEALARVVDRCLDRSRDARFRDGAALSEALVLALEQGEAEDARATRRRWLLVASAVGLLAGAGIGVAAAARHTPESPSTEGSAAPVPSASASAPATPSRPPTIGSASAPGPATRAPFTPKSKVITRVNKPGT
jgi:serine/threonine-protein kinase